MKEEVNYYLAFRDLETGKVKLKFGNQEQNKEAL